MFQNYLNYLKSLFLNIPSTGPDAVFTGHIYTAVAALKVLICWTLHVFRTFTSAIQFDGQHVFNIFCVYAKVI